MFFFARQNYAIFNGFTGYAGIGAPQILGIDMRMPLPFYYLCLALAGSSAKTTAYVVRSPFGFALQAMCDNPRRLVVPGYSITAVRIHVFFLAGVVAACGGVVPVLLSGRISPGTIGIDVVIHILAIAIIGGIRHPIGPMIGAVAFVLLENFGQNLPFQQKKISNSLNIIINCC